MLNQTLQEQRRTRRASNPKATNTALSREFWQPLLTMAQPGPCSPVVLTCITRSAAHTRSSFETETWKLDILRAAAVVHTCSTSHYHCCVCSWFVLLTAAMIGVTKMTQLTAAHRYHVYACGTFYV